MTSVKELGETLRKRQLAVEGGDATEDAMLGAGGSAYAILLVVGGCLTLAFGALLASVAVVAPDYVWVAESLNRMGITSGAVLAAGLSLLGLGLVAKAISQVQRVLMAAVRRAATAGGQAESLAEIREHLSKVHFALRVLQESTRSLLEAAHEHPFKREDSEHGDAVFRLAASLDQLGLRLEDRLDSQQSGIERRLGSLDSALEETRLRITEWLESSEDATPQPAPPPMPTSPPRQRPGKRRGRGRGESNELRAAQAPADSRRQPAGEERRREGGNGQERRRENEDEREEFELLVTLEEREERAAHRREREEAARRAPRNRTPLGVLDVLDDFGQGLAEADDDGPASSSFLFDEQLAARLEKLAGLDDAEDEPGVTQAKLAQLQTLLSDSKLRRVLEGLRTDGENDAPAK